MKPLFDPKVDFVFKKIFGNEKHPNILISFLNAVIKSDDKIKTVKLMETDINPDSIEDKFSRLDVKAITDRGEHINIEIQLKNEYNMIKRTLFYWSKMFSGQLNKGENYNQLARTICINILNFKFLKNIEHFHSCFRLKEVETNIELTDDQEIHFIEIPKLPKKADITDMLVAWIEFLKDPESEEVRSLEFGMTEFKDAKDELIRLSQNDKERILYDMREKANKDRTSALESAEEKGVQKGKIEVAKNLLKQDMKIEVISMATGLTEEDIKKLK